jgi:hypothetical protein
VLGHGVQVGCLAIGAETFVNSAVWSIAATVDAKSGAC